MKVLHIIPSINPRYGGPSKAVIEISEMSAENGIDVTAAFGAREHETGYIERLRSSLPTIRFLSFPYSFPKRISKSKEMESWLERDIKQFDVVHIHAIYSYSSVHAARVAAKNNIPYVLRPAGSLDKFDLQKKRFLKYVFASMTVRKLLDGAAYVQCTSDGEAEHLELFGSNANLQVLPIPVKKDPRIGSGDRFRAKYGIQPDDFALLFLSRIDYKKGLSLLIESLRRLAPKFPKLRLLIAGSDSNGYERVIRQLVEVSGVQERITFCGFLNDGDKLDAFAGSNCFVLPSMFENFGVAVVEALNAGRPVIISDRVYIWQEVVDGGAGWVCNYSIDSLTEVISQVVSNPREVSVREGNARIVGSKFSPGALAHSYCNLYSSCIGRYKSIS
ncbi:MAG: glycosyltransferase [Nitrososphaerota archaeon]|nr:glycosyltransferase [Nitrososphaerota archaeon]